MGSDQAVDASSNIGLISIHAPRMGSDANAIRAVLQARNRISIHAPRMGSDCRTPSRWARRATISIHAPRMGSDSAK